MTETSIEATDVTSQPPPSSITPSIQPTMSSSDLPDPSTEHAQATDNGSATAIRSPSSVPPLSLSSRTSEELATDSLQGKDADNASTDVPSDQVRITLLLISGSRHTFTFEPSTTVLQVKQHVLEHWPAEWSLRKTPLSVHPLELLYLGKFLENDSTIESNRIHGGQSATVHLIIRDHLSKDTEDANSGVAPRCKCCIIL